MYQKYSANDEYISSKSKLLIETALTLTYFFLRQRSFKATFTPCHLKLFFVPNFRISWRRHVYEVVYMHNIYMTVYFNTRRIYSMNKKVIRTF